ncbi:RNA polymerase sigma factor [Thalassoglobus polymorphus]|uniref:RNA polymerase sigma factor YlaC n=1 Tax=Thalassoglobus polymorphus TaxID=2527994 RepID=A0A517QP41_9PLAN|nr:sigma-70 family RNA polymerase sigma factor [Thalassoglobus polymorphus]QDT33420.1 RNA polymerase sigma factor YlaC [Thalassoglobus polymorphus]
MTDPPTHNLTLTTHDATTSEIITGLRNGQRSAWGQLYDEYSENLWKYVSRIIGNDAEAVAEVVQESFLAAARGARTFDETKGSLWAWLTGIAHRQSFAWFRKRTRSQKISRADVQRRIQSGQQGQDKTTAPVQILEDQEQAETVRAALSELSAEYSFLLTAKYMDRLTVDEIQNHLGGTSDSIRSKLRRARAEFRTVFERLNDGGPE